MSIDPPETRVAVVESRLDNHEKVCSERYEAIAKSLDLLGQKNDRLMWAFLAGLVAIVGYGIAAWVTWISKVPH